MISIDREMLWQWDYGQRVQLHDVSVGTAVHFSNAAIKPNALVTEAYEDDEGVYANIPNILLQTAGTLTAYIYLEDGDEGHTEYRKMFIVRDRERPDDYVYTEDDVKTWELLEERIKVLEESGGGAAGGLIRPLSEIGEIDGVKVVHVPDKDRVELTVEMTADSMNSVFGGNAVYKNDFLNARQLQLMFRIPGAGRLFLWELFEDDLITVTNYPNKKFIMVSTNRMIVSFTYDENGQYVSENKTYQANVQQLDEAKATIPNRATVNSAHALVMQRADGDNVTDLFGAYIPFAFESYRYFSEIDWGTTLGSSFVVRDPYISKGDVYPAIPDGCEAPFICHTTLVRYTLTVIVCTADGRFFKTHLDLPSMKFSSVTEITQQGGGTSDIPSTLPNPHPLTFTGAVEATYDGSTPVEVEILMGGSGGGEAWDVMANFKAEEDVSNFLQTSPPEGHSFSEYTELIVLLYVKPNSAEKTSYIKLSIEYSLGYSGFFRFATGGIKDTTKKGRIEILHVRKTDAGWIPVFGGRSYNEDSMNNGIQFMPNLSYDVLTLNKQPNADPEDISTVMKTEDMKLIAIGGYETVLGAGSMAIVYGKRGA